MAEIRLPYSAEEIKQLLANAEYQPMTYTEDVDLSSTQLMDKNLTVGVHQEVMDLSDFLPDDGYDYELIGSLDGYGVTSTTYGHLFLGTSVDSEVTSIGGLNCIACGALKNSNGICAVPFSVIVDGRRKFRIGIDVHEGTCKMYYRIVGYRRLGKSV